MSGGVMRYLAVLVLMLFSGSAAAQLFPENEFPSIHYAYAVQFGTGAYTVGDRDVYVLRATPTKTWRPAEPDQVGIKFKFPVSVGVHDFDFDDILGSVDRVATLSFVPGVWFRKPLKPRWTLQMLGHGGFGFELDGDENSVIWTGGLHSLYSFDEDRRFTMLNGLGYFGFNSNEGEHDDIVDLVNGLELEFPTGGQLWQKPSSIWLHGTFHYYLKDLEFNSPDGDFTGIEWEVDVGISFGTHTPNKILGFINVERIGIAYRTSKDNVLQGVRIFFSSPFS